MSDTNNDLSCDPANPRRLLVSGPGGGKYVTEDCVGVGDQAPVTVNAPGSTTKKLTQQAFHPSLFFTRPRSSSMGNIKTTDSENLPTTSSDKNTTDVGANKVCPPSWQRVPTDRYAKRKRLSNSPTQPEKVTHTAQTGITTANRYSGLPIDLTDEPTENLSTDGNKKVNKPPPVIPYGIEDLTKLTELLNKTMPSSGYSYKVINRDQLRVITQSTEIYKDLIELIRTNGLIGHTFPPKQDKCYRIVKNLHHTTPKTAITEEIEKTGNRVRGEIICAISRKNKKPLNMFFVNIEPSPNNREIKSIESIYHTRVKIEDPRKSTDIPQCTRCQQYGHTKNNCMRPYRCVKCAKGHKTTDCPKKDRNTPATCALCQGEHPTNYKGCQVYKEIRSRKMTQTDNRKTLLEKMKKATNSFTPRPEDFPPLKPPRFATQQSINNQERNTPPPSGKIHNNANTSNWRRKIENKQSQPTSSLEQIIIKQSEKIDILIQQIGTLMGLITTLVVQCKK
ncbi:hypothetical protein PYW07_014827 [Mythimna separata]|uniref:Pre-C2HC domain-containing protein n=1 Tax=Mythimna separata TaxID=271217 RepID=A0AAD8E0H5_MYTSE|nr:hypothetical protein PYW07_014827 [Mythimna separata]